jgi:uncharacterized membrane protein YjgN (DUF898 family)
MSIDQQAAPASASSALNFSGRAGEIAPIVIKNILLNIVTLGFYRFWGRTNVRRYLWRNINLFGSSLEYAGTGGELFKGFLIIAFAIFLPYFALLVVLQATNVLLMPGPNMVFQFASFVGFVLLIGVAIHRARRYRLSRTRWRGIRGAMSGSSLHFALAYLGHGVLLVLTLGWWLPKRNVHLWSLLIGQSSWGDRAFRFEGRAGPLYKRFAICWFLFLPTLGLSLIWYKARELSLLISGVKFENSDFRLQVGGYALLNLYFGNYLISLITLGLGVPFTQLRTFRFLTDNLTIAGQPDFDAILQSQDLGPDAGEGLAEAFDLGAV